MKRINIYIIFITMTIQMVIAQNNDFTKIEVIDKGQFLLLKLPYKVNADCNAVFDEDTPLAIDIIEIKADGRILSYIDDIRSLEGRTYWKFHTIVNKKTKYYITMYWDKCSAEILRWNDGRGIIFTEIEPNVFHPSTNSYELVKGMRNLEIKYRILLPINIMPWEGPEILDLRTKQYSDIYTVFVDLKNIWK